MKTNVLSKLCFVLFIGVALMIASKFTISTKTGSFGSSSVSNVVMPSTYFDAEYNSTGLWNISTRENITYKSHNSGHYYTDYIDRNNFHFFNPRKKVFILLFGDSLDRDIVSSLCMIGKKENFISLWKRFSNLSHLSNHDQNIHVWHSRACEKGNVFIANIFYRTVDLIEDNLSNMNAFSGLRSEDGLISGNIDVQMKFIERSFKNKSGGFSPDLVIFKSFYWDIYRLSQTFHCSLRCNSSSIYLSDSNFLNGYKKNFTTILQTISKIFPSSTVSTKIDPLWQQEKMERFFVKYGMTMPVFNFIGFSMHEIIRSVSVELKLNLFDFFDIFRQLQPDIYLADDIHPQKPFYLFEMNLIIAFISRFQSRSWVVTDL